MEPQETDGNWIKRGLVRCISGLLSILIVLYQRFISPFFPPNCRFEPTCSQYALEAIEVHGPLKGSWLTLRRLGRCHPVRILGGNSGYDPVPPKNKNTPQAIEEIYPPTHQRRCHD